MKKADLIAVFGTGTAVASLFKPYNNNKPLSKAAVSEWGNMGHIPELREFQVRELFPDIDERIAKAKRKRAKRGSSLEVVPV